MAARRDTRFCQLWLFSSLVTVSIWAILGNCALADNTKEITVNTSALKITDTADISIANGTLIINNGTNVVADTFNSLTNSDIAGNLVTNDNNLNLIQVGGGGSISISTSDIFINSNSGTISDSTSNPLTSGLGGNIVLTADDIKLTRVSEPSSTLGVLATPILASAILLKWRLRQKKTKPQ